MQIAVEIEYTVIIQAISILLAEKYPSIFGNATDMHAKSTVTNAVAIHAKNKI